METKEMLRVALYKGQGEQVYVDVEKGTSIRQFINGQDLSTKNMEVRVNAQPVQDLDETLIMEPDTVITLVPNVAGGL